MKTFDLATIPEYPRTKQDRQLREMTYQNFFESALEVIATGRTLSNIIDNDHRAIEQARFLRWVRKSPQRLARYIEAQEIAAEILASEIVAIADGKFNQEGHNLIEGNLDRDNTMIKARQWVSGVYNKRKFGQSKNIEMNVKDLGKDDIAKLTNSEIEQMLLDAKNATFDMEEEGEEDVPDWLN